MNPLKAQNPLINSGSCEHNKNIEIFKSCKKYYGDNPSKLYELDEYSFHHKFFLSRLTNSYISHFFPKVNYVEEVFDFLKKEFSLIYSIDTTSASFIKDNLVIFAYKEEEYIKLTFYYPTGQIPDLEEFDKFTIIDKKSRVSVLTRGSFGLETNSIKIDAPIIKNLELSYGSGFNKVHERIIEKLGGKKSSLMLFHGEAGSGKSSYIKYLTSLIDKEFIFIPIAYASELASPDLITLLLNHKDSILILEDAEKILESREVDTYNTSSVSTILNLSDGILSDLLNIKIIATFNCEADKTDPALRRKGRLSVDHYFGKLSHVDANKFAKSIGKETNFKESQSLADIYNLEEDTGHKEKEVRKMGFGA